MHVLMKALKGGGLLLIVGILAWRVLVTGLANYYAGQKTLEEQINALAAQTAQKSAPAEAAGK